MSKQTPVTVTQSGATKDGHSLNLFVMGELGRWVLAAVIVYQGLEIVGRLLVP